MVKSYLERAQTKEEVLGWMEDKRKNLDAQVKYFLEGIHRDLREIEEKVHKRLMELEE